MTAITNKITCVGFRFSLLGYSSLYRINPPYEPGMFMLFSFSAMFLLSAMGIKSL